MDTGSEAKWGNEADYAAAGASLCFYRHDSLSAFHSGQQK